MSVDTQGIDTERRSSDEWQGLILDQYHQLHRELVWLFRNNGETLEDARDLAQESLFEAFRCAGSFEGRTTLKGWVRSIGRHRWLHHRRRQSAQKRRTEASLEQLDREDRPESSLLAERATDGDPEVQQINRDLLRRTLTRVKALPPPQRNPLLLHVYGYKYREIAILLQLTESRVASLIHQARKTLYRELLEQPADLTAS